MAQALGPLRMFKMRKGKPKMVEAELIGKLSAKEFPFALASTEGEDVMKTLAPDVLRTDYAVWLNDFRNRRTNVLCCIAVKGPGSSTKVLRAVPARCLKHFFSDVTYAWATFKEGTVPPFDDSGKRPLFDPRYAAIAAEAEEDAAAAAVDVEMADLPKTKHSKRKNAATDQEVDNLFAKGDATPPPTPPPTPPFSSADERGDSGAEAVSDTEWITPKPKAKPKPRSKAKAKAKATPKAKSAARPKARARPKSAAKAAAVPMAKTVGDIAIDGSLVHPANAAGFRRTQLDAYHLWVGEVPADVTMEPAKRVLKQMTGNVNDAIACAGIVEGSAALLHGG